jgi:non-homologous end joining protein Ku
MVLITLRAADEVRAAEFRSAEGEIDPEMVAIAETIITRRTDTFDRRLSGTVIRTRSKR